MTNPYAPGLLVDESNERSHVDSPVVSLFWMKHFIAFQISFVTIWFALIFANLGFASALEELLKAPEELLAMAACGVVVWVPHAILAFTCRKMRRLPLATAAIGSTFFLGGMLIFDLLGKYLPRDMSMSLSWTPTYVLVSLYTALSLTAVWAFVRFRSDGGAGG